MPQTAESATLEQAHRAVLARRDLQFDLKEVPSPPPPSPPDWLKQILEFLGSLFRGTAPIIEVLFWIIVAAAVLGLVFLIVRELGGLDWAIKKRKRAPLVTQYRPDAQVAQTLLADADALAAEGRFAEAVHVLLLRSIEDMRQRRPRALRPSFTSRDIGALDILPAQARSAFGAMADLVETSLFGGRTVDAAGFEASRKAYATFAFDAAWT